MNRSEMMTQADAEGDLNSLVAYISPLRRWWWLLLTSTLVATLSMALATFTEPTQYSSRATVMIGASIRDPNPNSGELYLAQQLVATYVDLIQRASVSAPAMAALGMTRLPDYTARQAPGTQLMEINVIDTDPARAQAVGQALIDQLIALSPEGLQEQKRADFIEQELDALQAGITETKAEIERRQSELAAMFSARQIADAQTQLDALQSKLSSLQSNFTALLATTQKGAVNTLTVIEPPSTGAPVDNNMLYKLLMAAAIGCLLAVGGAYLLEFLDKSFKNSDEVQQRLGLATLSAVPEIELDKAPHTHKLHRFLQSKRDSAHITRTGRAPGATEHLASAPLSANNNPSLVMLHDNQSPAAEAFRVLRTNLQFAAVAHPVRSLVVSSPLPAEGKSLISANLAIAAAQAGNRVVLIDCDLHRPRQHHVFGLGNGLGVTTALLGIEGVALEQFLQPGPLPTLRIMTSGPLPPNAPEMLGSARMSALLAEIGQQADLIIIDSPPASVLADAAVLSHQVDGVLLVLHAKQTSRDVAKRTVAALRQVQAHLVGVVLNRMPTRGHGYSSYYSYYNYDYSRQYYRRDDALVGGALPVTPARPASNGKLSLSPIPFITTTRSEPPHA
ncbi:MAG: polysaccharide biosynthesis tyrosine autokinase [Caldilinea sp.]